MQKISPKAPQLNIDNICAAVDRISITTDPNTEIVVVSRTTFKDTDADVTQMSVVKFDPVVIKISSVPSSSNYTAQVKISNVVSAATIAAAAAAGAYAYRINIKKQTAVMSNLNNEVSGSYDQMLAAGTNVRGEYKYDLNNINKRIVAEAVDNLFETPVMPIAQATSTVLYTAVFDFNQLRAMASNVQADMTLDMSVEVEVVFSYSSAPPAVPAVQKATGRKFF